MNNFRNMVKEKQLTEGFELDGDNGRAGFGGNGVGGYLDNLAIGIDLNTGGQFFVDDWDLEDPDTKNPTSVKDLIKVVKDSGKKITEKEIEQIFAAFGRMCFEKKVTLN